MKGKGSDTIFLKSVCVCIDIYIYAQKKTNVKKDVNLKKTPVCKTLFK